MYVLELVGEDDAFASYEARCLADDVRVVGPGVALAGALGPRIDQVAYTRAIDAFVARTALSVDAAVAALRETALDRSGTAAVRARAVRGADLDTQRVERALGDVLVDRGFAIDLEAPDHELRALGTGDTCVLGWRALEPTPGFGDRQPTDRPFFRPGSMAPRLARAIVNIAGAGPGRCIVDPMCGTGGLLLEAALVDARPVGGDVDRTMLAGSRENLAALAPGVDAALVQADATAMPVRANAVDAVAFDAPYGRQSAVAGRDPAQLATAALAEARRLADRAVVVTDRSIDPEAAGWALAARFEHRVHRSLTRYLHVLEGPAEPVG